MSQALTNKVERLSESLKQAYQRIDALQARCERLEDALRAHGEHVESNFMHKRGRKSNGGEHRTAV